MRSRIDVRYLAPLHHNRRGRAIACMAMAFVFAGQASTAQAQSPSDSGTPGITVDPNGPRTPAQLGYAQSYADTKGAHFINALKVRMATFASTSGVAPELVGSPAPMRVVSGESPEYF